MGGRLRRERDAARTESTESLAILGTLAYPHLLCHVKVHAFVTCVFAGLGQLPPLAPRRTRAKRTVGAKAILCKEPALWHLAEVVLVHELARVALLAEPSEPVLAYRPGVGGGWDGLWREEVEWGGGDVAFRTGGATGAGRVFEKVSAELRVRVELDPELVLHKRFLPARGASVLLGRGEGGGGEGCTYDREFHVSERRASLDRSHPGGATNK